MVDHFVHLDPVVASHSDQEFDCLFNVLLHWRLMRVVSLFYIFAQRKVTCNQTITSSLILILEYFRHHLINCFAIRRHWEWNGNRQSFLSTQTCNSQTRFDRVWFPFPIKTTVEEREILSITQLSSLMYSLIWLKLNTIECARDRSKTGLFYGFTRDYKKWQKAANSNRYNYGRCTDAWI